MRVLSDLDRKEIIVQAGHNHFTQKKAVFRTLLHKLGRFLLTPVF
jgi:hypothetical protein